MLYWYYTYKTDVEFLFSIVRIITRIILSIAIGITDINIFFLPIHYLSTIISSDIA